jgi:peptidoglycan hydrolase CwlO-like protein
VIKKFDEFVFELLAGVPAINQKQKELKALEDKLENHDSGVKELDDKEIEETEKKVKMLKAVIKQLKGKLNENSK